MSNYNQSVKPERSFTEKQIANWQGQFDSCLQLFSMRIYGDAFYKFDVCKRVQTFT